MNNNFIPLKRIRIEGFLDKQIIEFNIVNGIAIIIGENGLGKTKILNLINAIFNKDISTINSSNFSRIKFYFNKGMPISLKRINLLDNQPNNYIMNYQREIEERDKGFHDYHSSIRRLILRYKITDYSDLFDLRNNRDINVEDRRELNRIARVTSEQTFKYILNETGGIYNNFFTSLDEKVGNKDRDTEVFYLPTYRRVEENLLDLGLGLESRGIRDDIKKNLINFGMSDVEKLFEEEEKNIKDILILGLNTLTGSIVSKLCELPKEKIGEQIINEEELDSALNRLTEHIGEKERIKIKEIVENNNINNEKNLALKAVLLNIIEQYHEQQKRENNVIKFKDICNKYLEDKNVFYDPKDFKIGIRLNSGKELKLNDLSSGEKQLISIISKIYLSQGKKFIILFDEPELSLSIKWQKNILGDIINSGNILLMIAVTHSPFIISENLEQYTSLIINKTINE